MIAILSQRDHTRKKLHENFFIFSAENHHELGEKMGMRFRTECRTSIHEASRHASWAKKKEMARSHIPLHTKYFPQYIMELQGYASGANVDFLDLFAISFEDELDSASEEHCTSIITEQGSLIAHNEDWNETSADKVCIIQKTIRDTTLLELYYYNTLGGNALSINSHGYVSMVNSLPFRHPASGISKNFLARFLSETKDAATDSKYMSQIPKMSSYSITLIKNPNEILNIEFDHDDTIEKRPTLPFIHTNHYLSRENPTMPDTTSTTYDRFNAAQKTIHSTHSIEDLKNLTETHVDSNADIFNPRTIARVLIDLPKKQILIWLRRESTKGFITYPFPV